MLNDVLEEKGRNVLITTCNIYFKVLYISFKHSVLTDVAKKYTQCYLKPGKIDSQLTHH